LPKKYPPLTFNEVIDILKTRGFILDRIKGSHHQYIKTTSGKKLVVTVDKSESPFDVFLIKSMIQQSGSKRKEFYCSTKSTAKKLNLKFEDPSL
jgi:predicted RNA binding protein YcfA (HicA-like mRNA interferase family)